MLKDKKGDNSNPELTLDDLARMVQEGFAKTASKEDFNTLDARITGLDRKMDAQFQDIMHELKPLKKLAPNLEADRHYGARAPHQSA